MPRKTSDPRIYRQALASPPGERPGREDVRGVPGERWQLLSQIVDPKTGLNILELGLGRDAESGDASPKTATILTTPFSPLRPARKPKPPSPARCGLDILA